MPKIKKLLVYIGVLLMLSATTIFAASGGYYCGSNSNLHYTWNTGTDLRGDYIDAYLEGYGNLKQVYVRMGSSGIYSDWIGSNTLLASASDYGAFGDIGNGNYYSCPYWR